MKKCMVVSAFVLLMGLLPVFAAEQSVVFINLDRAFNEFYKTKLADTQLKQQADEFNDERKSLVADYEKLQKEFGLIRDEAQNTALSDDVRTEKRNLAEEKLVEVRDYESRIRRFDDSRRKQLDDQSRRMRKRIVEEIQQIVKDYAQTQGYQAVIDSSGQSLNGVEIILYTDPKIDITDTVLGLLNKGKREEAPASESKQEEKPAAK
jgi:outer membrane protein